MPHVHVDATERLSCRRHASPGTVAFLVAARDCHEATAKQVGRWPGRWSAVLCAAAGDCGHRRAAATSAPVRARVLVPGNWTRPGLRGRARQPEAVFDLARGSPLPGPPRTRGRGRRPGRRAGELLSWGCRAGRSRTRSPRAAHAPGCVGSRTPLLRPPRRCGERVAPHLPGGRPGHWASRPLTLIPIVGTSVAATGSRAPPLPGRWWCARTRRTRAPSPC